MEVWAWAWARAWAVVEVGGSVVEDVVELFAAATVEEGGNTDLAGMNYFLG